MPVKQEWLYLPTTGVDNRPRPVSVAASEILIAARTARDELFSLRACSWWSRCHITPPKLTACNTPGFTFFEELNFGGELFCLLVFAFDGVICVLFGGLLFSEKLALLFRHFPFVRFSFIKPVSCFLMHRDLLRCFPVFCEPFHFLRHLPFSWDILYVCSDSLRQLPAFQKRVRWYLCFFRHLYIVEAVCLFWDSACSLRHVSASWESVRTIELTFTFGLFVETILSFIYVATYSLCCTGSDTTIEAWDEMQHCRMWDISIKAQAPYPKEKKQPRFLAYIA
jgi:hypothetical protein